MAYIPDCNNPEVARLLPTLCSFPPDIQAQICSRQPSLCVPVDYDPSVWEPIIGTAGDIGKKILTTEAGIGTGVSKTLDVVALLGAILPAILIGGGIYYLMKR